MANGRNLIKIRLKVARGEFKIKVWNLIFLIMQTEENFIPVDLIRRIVIKRGISRVTKYFPAVRVRKQYRFINPVS